MKKRHSLNLERKNHKNFIKHIEHVCVTPFLQKRNREAETFCTRPSSHVWWDRTSSRKSGKKQLIFYSSVKIISYGRVGLPFFRKAQVQDFHFHKCYTNVPLHFRAIGMWRKLVGYKFEPEAVLSPKFPIQQDL